MKLINDKLSEIFDVEPISTTDIVEAKPLPVQENNNKALDQDYEITRNNLHSLLQQGQDALMHALEVAKQSEHPRAFEVVGGLMKHLSDINHQLLDLHSKKKTLEGPSKKEDPSSKTVTNNSIFVGSTAELSTMLENLRKQS